MPTPLEALDFAEPYTQALFDRTLEQRYAFGQHMLRLIADPDSDNHSLDVRASKEMYEDFLGDIQALKDERLAKVQQLDVPEGIVASEDALTEIVLSGIRDELAQLHEALPFPMIDRLVASND